MAKGSQGSKGGGKGTGHTPASGDSNRQGTGGHRKSPANDQESKRGEGSDRRETGAGHDRDDNAD